MTTKNEIIKTFKLRVQHLASKSAVKIFTELFGVEHCTNYNTLDDVIKSNAFKEGRVVMFSPDVKIYTMPVYNKDIAILKSYGFIEISRESIQKQYGIEHGVSNDAIKKLKEEVRNGLPKIKSFHPEKKYGFGNENSLSCELFISPNSQRGSIGGLNYSNSFIRLTIKVNRVIKFSKTLYGYTYLNGKYTDKTGEQKVLNALKKEYLKELEVQLNKLI